MVKKRIIPLQLLSKGRLLKTRQFASPRDVGDPVASSKVYNDQSADELIFLNIDQENPTIGPLVELLERVSKVCFMPLTMGGGIRQFEDAVELIKNGCDKVLVNTACYQSPQLIQKISEAFGAQALVAGIDVRLEDGEYVLWSRAGRIRERVDLEAHIRSLVEAGVGELFVNSIDRDGMMKGYDVALIKRAVIASSVPVIAGGGAGTYDHLRELFVETDVAAAACGSLFNFGDNNPIRAKAHLTNYGLSFKRI